MVIFENKNFTIFVSQKIGHNKYVLIYCTITPDNILLYLICYSTKNLMISTNNGLRPGLDLNLWAST